jgi:hypothetical protein
VLVMFVGGSEPLNLPGHPIAVTEPAACPPYPTAEVLAADLAVLPDSQRWAYPPSSTALMSSRSCLVMRPRACADASGPASLSRSADTVRPHRYADA